MIIPFTKCHGLGNDYLFIDQFRTLPLPEEILRDLAVQMSRRHTGAGADGIVLFGPHPASAAWMRIFNADGSEAESCGNALRCTAALLYRRGYVSGTTFIIETKGGPVNALVHTPADTPTASVSIDIGKPAFQSPDFPHADSDGESSLQIMGTRYRIQCVSVGNPHCVLFFDELPSEHTIAELGPVIEHHTSFPHRINVEFCHIPQPDLLEMRVWERGSGITLACGTGAAAAFAAARKHNLIDPSATVKMPGGALTFKETETGRLIMTGPSEEVYSGTWVFRPVSG